MHQQKLKEPGNQQDRDEERPCFTYVREAKRTRCLAKAADSKGTFALFWHPIRTLISQTRNTNKTRELAHVGLTELSLAVLLLDLIVVSLRSKVGVASRVGCVLLGISGRRRIRLRSPDSRRSMSCWLGCARFQGLGEVPTLGMSVSHHTGFYDEWTKTICKIAFFILTREMRRKGALLKVELFLECSLSSYGTILKGWAVDLEGRRTLETNCKAKRDARGHEGLTSCNIPKFIHTHAPWKIVPTPRNTSTVRPSTPTEGIFALVKGMVCATKVVKRNRVKHKRDIEGRKGNEYRSVFGNFVI
ncbi:uncharacterized protein BDR25DRAFT_392229 [Lindgomyces ingoldianus]|uniref:Uncharacterized protein n=1 Tax=Lindgomyces ingoldianus TaxID=673940 RepID=A0ACB6R3W6_9PLEO|nr:uncharacterized protein BDR25DRAFT_392229 [Lindgomyces ingoldianus]KAF2473790.1 hypothetical protein BDR25DRAFT_392229 [Lindgomyces ingoldianus]